MARAGALNPGARQAEVIGRRELLGLLGGAAVAWPVAARGQQGDRMRRIGVLLPAAADDAEFRARLAAFHQGLALLGWTIGRNVRIDIRWATANAADIRKHAAELAALAPNSRWAPLVEPKNVADDARRGDVSMENWPCFLPL
jgi:hypothetical protein